METWHIELDIDSNNHEVQLASSASGLTGDKLIREALALGLKQLSKPIKPKKTKLAPQPIVPLTADDIRKRFLENRKRGVFTENGFTPEQEERIAQSFREAKQGKGRTFKTLAESDAAILGGI
jgi:hypothetical protein